MNFLLNKYILYQGYPNLNIGRMSRLPTYTIRPKVCKLKKHKNKVRELVIKGYSDRESTCTQPYPNSLARSSLLLTCGNLKLT